MNYYERHIGDYIKDTVSLTMLEDGAYNRLIDQCYQTERPLPLEVKEIYREARANTAAERKAVDYVLGKFFERTADGYAQKRIGAEILRYQEKQRKAKASADARWAKDKPHSDGNANASQTHDAQDMRTHSDGNALQTPDTKHQTPGKKARKPRATSPDLTLEEYLAQCKAAGTKPIPTDHAIRQYCEDAGITDEMRQVAWLVFKEKHLTAPTPKKQKDWPTTFANAVKGRWDQLWYPSAEGPAEWTATGLQAKRVVENRLKAKEQHLEPA